MDVRSHVLTANQVLMLNTGGRFFMLVAADAAVASIQFVKDRSTTRETARSVEAGYASFPGDWRDEDDRFDGVRITNGATAQTIQIGISDRTADYRRVVGIFQIQQPNALATADPVTVSSTAIEVAASNANRRKLILQNVGANPVRIGDLANVSTTRGIRLAAGGSMTLDTTAQVAAIREGASDSTVVLLEETRT